MAQLKVGDDAVRVVRAIAIANPSVSAFKFLKYQPRSGLEDRLKADKDREIKRAVAKAEEIQAKYSLNDAIRTALLTMFWTDIKFDEVLKKLLYHNTTGSSGIKLSQEEVLGGRLEEEIKGLKRGEALALNSRCRMEDGSEMHLPMIDFHCSPSDMNQNKIRRAVIALRQKRGAILESGASYHFYGFELSTRADWYEFIGRCLLLAPLTDVRFVAHRIIQGMCTLRITSSELKREVPRVVELVDEQEEK